MTRVATENDEKLVKAAEEMGQACKKVENADRYERVGIYKCGHFFLILFDRCELAFQIVQCLDKEATSRGLKN